MTLTRQQALAGAAIVMGSIATGAAVRAGTQAMQASKRGDTQTALHQERNYRVSAKRIYDALLVSRTFAAFSHAPAQIDPVAGGAFSLFGGLIIGRNLELVPNARIVQGWRSDQSWDPGVYSIVRFEIVERDEQTLLVLDQTGFPAGTYNHLYAGWKAHYFEPLAAYFGLRR